MENWTKIFTSNKEHLIAMAKQMLEDKGFEAQVFNQKDSIYLFGYIYLYVKNENAEACKPLIAQFKKDLEIE
jgi:hypothetical protein